LDGHSHSWATLTVCGKFSIAQLRHLAPLADKPHIIAKQMLVRRVCTKVACAKDFDEMSRITPFASPLLLGFDAMEKTLERIAKANDGYPPYNIERLGADLERGFIGGLRITLAVAGFSEDELDVTTEENQLIIRGRQVEQGERDYLHRGIAARQFQRVFVLADGMAVQGAVLRNGLLSVDLMRPEPERMVKKINISVSE
jgi:HSP20 family molecular chaperone IbpA